MDLGCTGDASSFTPCYTAHELLHRHLSKLIVVQQVAQALRINLFETQQGRSFDEAEVVEHLSVLWRRLRYGKQLRHLFSEHLRLWNRSRCPGPLPIAITKLLLVLAFARSRRSLSSM